MTARDPCPLPARRRALLAMSLFALPAAASAANTTANTTTNTTTDAATATPTASPPPPLPRVATGRVERLQIASRHVDPRPVDVWLPEGADPARRHAVLYMHDGQMLYDARTTWNGQAWDVHLAVDRLMRAGRIPPTIVVGVWNAGPLRHSEYHPEQALAFVPEPQRSAYVDRALAGRPRANAYLRFLVEELKPAIDARYATRPEREATAVLGSSMGGMASVYALCEQPQVFGGAAGLSTHWVAAHAPNATMPLAAFRYLHERLPPPDGVRRLYMDHGTTELDALYAPYQAFVDEIVRERGYTAQDSMLRSFPGTGHNERAWAARVDVAIAFLLGGR